MTDTKNHFAAPKTVALYMEMSGALQGYVWVREVNYASYDEQYNPLPEGEKREKHDKTCVRISEPVEVAFAAANNDQVVANAVAALDEAERQAIEDLNKTLAEIRSKKAQFLALTHTPENA